MNQLASRKRSSRQPGPVKVEPEMHRNHLEPVPTLVLSSVPQPHAASSRLHTSPRHTSMPVFNKY